MKFIRSCLFISMWSILSFQAYSQDTLNLCIPDSAFIADGGLISPTPYVNDTLGDGIPVEACINTPYDVRFMVSAPSNIVVLSLPVTVTSIRIDSIENLPDGVSYQCTADDCNIPADSVSCIFLKGTPTDTNQPGVYELKINLTINTSFGPITVSYPDPLLAPGSYSLLLNEEGHDNCDQSTPVFDVVEPTETWSIYPNPADSRLSIEHALPPLRDARLDVLGISGEVLSTNTIAGWQAGDIQQLEVSRLKAGLHIVRVTWEDQVIFKKFVKH